MKNRLPRKRKKEVKKIIARKTASKMVMVALVTAQSMARTTIVLSTPFKQAYDKVIYVIKNAAEIATHIGTILSEPPTSWKEFVKINK